MNKIFLVKLYDRHIDDTYAAFKTLDGAIAQCEKWAEEYGVWNIPTWNWQQHWKFYKDAGEDCPSVSVEEIELH